MLRLEIPCRVVEHDAPARDTGRSRPVRGATSAPLIATSGCSLTRAPCRRGRAAPVRPRRALPHRRGARCRRGGVRRGAARLGAHDRREAASGAERQPRLIGRCGSG
jgi:hypothetical protein